MILDKQCMMSDDQTLAFNIGAELSTKSIDLGLVTPLMPGGQAYPNGAPMTDQFRVPPGKFLCQVTADLDSGDDNATLKVELVGADDTALSSNLVVYDVSLVIAQATCVNGYIFKLDWPQKVAKRYIGCRYTIATSNATAGTITSAFAMDVNSGAPLGG